MKRARLAAGAASFLLSSVICFPALAEPVCWHPYEVDAAMVRNLQTLMMVGTLKCGNRGGAMEAQYNSFIIRNRNMITNSNNVLKAHYMRESGIAKGQESYDGFVTGLANTHSSPAHLEGFCQVSESLMALAEGAEERDVTTLARTFAGQPAGVGESCKAEQIASAVPPATALAPDTSVTGPALADQPAPQSAAAALHAAAVAMQAAAKALETPQAAAPAVVTSVATGGSSGGAIPADLNTQVVEPAPVVPPPQLN